MKTLNRDSDSEESFEEVQNKNDARFYFIEVLKGKVKKRGEDEGACMVSEQVGKTLSFLTFEFILKKI
jgi:hypothetical protein